MDEVLYNSLKEAYLRANIPNFQPSTEDIKQLEELEATKPSIPCPFQ